MAYIRVLAPGERKNALRRMDENASIIDVVRKRLDERVSSYRYALERLVIMTPMPRAAEHRLNHLHSLVAYYGTYTAPTPVLEQSLASMR
jgi:nitrate reductase assembly molybdenum cofactor insertion protein NarJ